MCFQSPNLLIGKVRESTLENGQDSRTVQIDFSAAFDKADIKEFFISSTRSVSFGSGSALWVYIPTVSNRSQHVMADG